MRLDVGGKITSVPEVTQIDNQGISLLILGKEFCLPYKQFPWFKDATVGQILNMELLHDRVIRWPDLDIDLAIESIEHPERFPLIAK